MISIQIMENTGWKILSEMIFYLFKTKIFRYYKVAVICPGRGNMSYTVKVSCPGRKNGNKKRK